MWCFFGEFAYYSQSPHFRLPNSPVFRKCACNILGRDLPSLFVLSLQHANVSISFFAIAAYYFTRRIFRHYYIICRKIRRFLRVRMLSCFRWAFYLFVTHRPVIYIIYSVRVRVLFSVVNFKKPSGCYTMGPSNLNICGFQFRFLLYIFVNLHLNLCWAFINIILQ